MSKPHNEKQPAWPFIHYGALPPSLRLAFIQEAARIIVHQTPSHTPDILSDTARPNDDRRATAENPHRTRKRRKKY